MATCQPLIRLCSSWKEKKKSSHRVLEAAMSTVPWRLVFFSPFFYPQLNNAQKKNCRWFDDELTMHDLAEYGTGPEKTLNSNNFSTLPNFHPFFFLLFPFSQKNVIYKIYFFLLLLSRHTLHLLYFRSNNKRWESFSFFANHKLNVLSATWS